MRSGWVVVDREAIERDEPWTAPQGSHTAQEMAEVQRSRMDEWYPGRAPHQVRAVAVDGSAPSGPMRRALAMTDCAGGAGLPAGVAADLGGAVETTQVGRNRITDEGRRVLAGEGNGDA